MDSIELLLIPLSRSIGWEKMHKEKGTDNIEKMRSANFTA